MLKIRPDGERGQSAIDWLDSRHTFSFADYHDPGHMGFRTLRVINEDRILPASGFGTHPHRDMEIITYVLEGALEHQDNMGTGSIIRPGDIQRMSAGTGVTHSEWNRSATEPLHLLQIWIVPERRGMQPSYEQKTFSGAELIDTLALVASRDGRAGSVRLHQDAALYVARPSAGSEIVHALVPGRHAWVQVARGSVSVNATPLAAGDGAAASGEGRLVIAAETDAEVLVFDLA